MPEPDGPVTAVRHAARNDAVDAVEHAARAVALRQRANLGDDGARPRLGARGCGFRRLLAFGRRRNHDAAVLDPRARPCGDPADAQQLLRQPQPAAAREHDLLCVPALRRGLGADAPVADVDDAIRDRRGLRIVADDDRRQPLLARELADQRVRAARVRRVELAGRLVGDQQPRPVRDRSGERNALLLATGELAPAALRLGPPRPTRSSSSSARRSRSATAPAPSSAGCSATSSRTVSSGASATRVVLVEIAEHAPAVVAQGRPAAKLAQVVAEHRHGSRGRHVEPREDAEQRRLPGSARPEDDDDLARLHAHRQPLQRDGAAVAVDAEDVVRLDGAHAGLRAVAALTSEERGDGEHRKAEAEQRPVERDDERRQRRRRARRDRDDGRDERDEDRAGHDAARRRRRLRRAPRARADSGAALAPSLPAPAGRRARRSRRARP